MFIERVKVAREVKQLWLGTDNFVVKLALWKRKHAWHSLTATTVKEIKIFSPYEKKSILWGKKLKGIPPFINYEVSLTWRRRICNLECKLYALLSARDIEQ